MPNSREDKLLQILKTFYRQTFEHAMALGQEFPKDDPKKMHDPCNADDRNATLAALNMVIDEEVREELERIVKANTRSIKNDGYYVQLGLLLEMRIAELGGSSH